MSITANVSSQESVMVPLARIPTHEGAQTRVRVRAAVVRDYAAAMKQQCADGGLRFPPVILFLDAGRCRVEPVERSENRRALSGGKRIREPVTPEKRICVRDTNARAQSRAVRHGLRNEA